MIKTVIIDDEAPAIDELKYLLDSYQSIEVVATFLNPLKALEYLLVNDVDVCFVDISMPLMNGFEFANALFRLKEPPTLIFATAFDEYAIQAFEVNAVDYLLKPISKERLDLTCQRIVNHLIHNKEHTTKVNEVSKTFIKGERMPLWKNDRICLVNVEDIVYFEVKDSKTNIYTSDTVYISNEPLSYYTDILANNSFYRCHRNYLINISHITEVIPWFNNTYVVKLNGLEQEIPISRRNLKQFKTLLNI